MKRYTASIKTMKIFIQYAYTYVIQPHYEGIEKRGTHACKEEKNLKLALSYSLFISG